MNHCYREKKVPGEQFTRGFAYPDFPVVVFISAGNDGSGASAWIDRIRKGFTFKKVSEPIISRGDVTSEDLEKCYELGRLIAAGCDMKIF